MDINSEQELEIILNPPPKSKWEIPHEVEYTVDITTISDLHKVAMLAYFYKE